MPPLSISITSTTMTSINPSTTTDVYKRIAEPIGITLAVLIVMGGLGITVYSIFYRRLWVDENNQLVRLDHKKCRLKQLKGYNPKKAYKAVFAPVRTVTGKPISMDDSSYHPVYTMDQPAVKPGKAVTQICGVETKP